LCEDGRTFVGVNVENASYGLTICAERAAVAAAVAAGARRFSAIVVVCSGLAPPSPCGACRQVLCELPPAFSVRCYGRDGALLDSTTDALLPERFALSR
jgi:cytidine deaminase